MIKYLIAFLIVLNFSYISAAVTETVTSADTQTNSQLNNEVRAPSVNQAIIQEANVKVDAATEKLSAPLTEKEIPLNIDINKKNSENTSTTGRLLMSVMILFVILFSTYYLVKKYKISNNINKSNKQIKVISQHYLGPKKSLAIIHVAGESILIGVTDTQISMIKSLSLIDDEIPENLPHNFSDSLQVENQNQTKKEIINNRSNNDKNFKDTNNFVATAAKDEFDEDFSFSGIKDTVSQKIKSMRSI